MAICNRDTLVREVDGQALRQAGESVKEWNETFQTATIDHGRITETEALASKNVRNRRGRGELLVPVADVEQIVPTWPKDNSLVIPQAKMVPGDFVSSFNTRMNRVSVANLSFTLTIYVRNETDL